MCSSYERFDESVFMHCVHRHRGRIELAPPPPAPPPLPTLSGLQVDDGGGGEKFMRLVIVALRIDEQI